MQLENLCESFNRYTPVSKIWNYIQRFKRVSTPKLPKNDEWIRSFMDKYAPQAPENEIDEFRYNISLIKMGILRMGIFTIYLARIQCSPKVTKRYYTWLGRHSICSYS